MQMEGVHHAPSVCGLAVRPPLTVGHPQQGRVCRGCSERRTGEGRRGEGEGGEGGSRGREGRVCLPGKPCKARAGSP